MNDIIPEICLNLFDFTKSWRMCNVLFKRTMWDGWYAVHGFGDNCVCIVAVICDSDFYIFADSRRDFRDGGQFMCGFAEVTIRTNLGDPEMADKIRDHEAIKLLRYDYWNREYYETQFRRVYRFR